MGRALVYDCLPWLALLLASGVALWWLVRLNEGRLNFRRLLSLHRNEVGSAQSLSFVLTLPFFVVIVLFIVQVSQLMIATMMVHYAAFAAARAAVVWIPARLGLGLSENCGEAYAIDNTAADQMPPSYVEPGSGGLTYVLSPGGFKAQKIATAAYLACLPICPSRDVDGTMASDAATEQALRAAFTSLSGRSATQARMRNKLAYAIAHTGVTVTFYHDNAEPPLVSPLTGGPYGIAYDGGNTGPGIEEFQLSREIGWQDPITVTVTHYLALLPGPGRLLANKVGLFRTPTNSVEQQIEQDTQEVQAPNNLYVYKLKATCTLGNEGEKSVLPYEYQAN